MQTIGEIIIRGDNVMDGYYKEPQATAAVMTNGWLHTGDMAVWDEENRVHIVDRKKDIIISGGENISSIEVERAIAAHPSVLECAVVSAPDPQWGEVPAAFIVVKPGHTLDQAGLCEFLQTAHRQIQAAAPLPFQRYRAAQNRHRKDRQTRTARDIVERERAAHSRLKRQGTAMWQQTYTPIGDSLPLSALFAAIPIFTLLLLLGVFRKPAWIASLAGLAAAAIVAGGVYGMPVGLLYRTDHLRRRVRALPHRLDGLQRDPALPRHAGERKVRNPEGLHRPPHRPISRLQALLIAFAFGAFIEGAAGFGTPVAVAAAMLTGLGFEPFYAAAICLLANTAPVAFGSIAIPITTLALTTGLPLDRLSAGVGRICAPVSLFVPAYLILVMSGWKGLKGVLLPASLCGIAFAGTQFYVSNFVGPQLTDILASVAAMGVLIAGDQAPRRTAQQASRRRRSCRRGCPICCSPFSCCCGPSRWPTRSTNTTSQLSGADCTTWCSACRRWSTRPRPTAAVYNFTWLSASGTACLFAALLSAVVAGLSMKQFGKVLGHTCKQLALAELTLAAVLGLAFLMNYSGSTGTLGLAFAATGSAFPFFSAMLGWLGVFLTGSDTSANALFGTLQVVTAQKLGHNPVLMASANSAGGVMGKMISLTSIAVAAAATSMKREDEARLFRFTLKHSIFLASVIGLLTMFYAYVMPSWAP